MKRPEVSESIAESRPPERTCRLAGCSLRIPEVTSCCCSCLCHRASFSGVVCSPRGADPRQSWWRGHQREAMRVWDLYKCFRIPLYDARQPRNSTQQGEGHEKGRPHRSAEARGQDGGKAGCIGSFSNSSSFNVFSSHITPPPLPLPLPHPHLLPPSRSQDVRYRARLRLHPAIVVA